MTTTNDMNFSEDWDFNQALEKLDEENKESTGGFSNPFDKILWSAPKKEGEIVFRIYGPPIQLRSQPWHARYLWTSQIISDTGKYYTDIFWKEQADAQGFPTGKLDTDWVLKKMIDKVFDKTWDNTPWVTAKGEPKKGKYIFHHVGKKIYDVLKDNRKVGASWKFYPQVDPYRRVLLPVLSRNTDQNEKLRQVGLLTSRYEETQGKTKGENPTDVTYVNYDYGITENLYDTIMSEIVKKHGHWNFDLVLKKHIDANTKKSVLTLYASSSSEISALSRSIARRPNLKEKMVEVEGQLLPDLVAEKMELTPDEKAYSKYDLNTMFTHTPYRKLLSVKGHFALCDQELKTNFEEMFIHYLKEEDKLTGYNETNANHYIMTSAIPMTTDNFQPSGDANRYEPPKEAPVPQAPNPSAPPTPQAPPVAESTGSAGSLEWSKEQKVAKCREVFKSWDAVSEADRQVTLDSLLYWNGNLPVYKPGKEIFVCGCPTEGEVQKFPGTDVQINAEASVKNCLMCNMLIG